MKMKLSVFLPNFLHNRTVPTGNKKKHYKIKVTSNIKLMDEKHFCYTCQTCQETLYISVILYITKQHEGQ